MVTWREAMPSSDAAGVLLDQYFTARALDFPAGAEHYQRTVVSDEQFTPPRGVFLIVEGENLSGEPADVGCGGIRRIDDGPAGARFEIKHLWVQPHTRRLGYGRALMSELERRSREFGGRELVLDTHESLEQAAGLYRALGFTPIEPYNENPNATTWLGRVL
ncbi:GNAT family N-acetyltransferase [Microcella sp.]|uniref:GNAT family N-acetyltransferase n=1 Tax=Microcella sp. TaxID=1913979 RepID=UPI002561B144|nr:GNAT family N-acetyltransferase [Microcella sp.]MBX9470574.1 GNAT family N-acetyltransferase [Microcella sp.]